MSVTKGVYIALFLNFLLVVKNVLTKSLVTNAGYSVIQALFFSVAVSLIIMGVYMFRRGSLPKIKKVNGNLLLHIFFAVGGGVLIFYAFGYGNLAEITIILAVAPLIVALLSYFWLGEQITKMQGVLIFASLLGVSLIVKPSGTGASEVLPVIAGVAGTVLFAMSQVWVRKINNEFSTDVLTIYYYIGTMVFTGLMLSFNYQPIQIVDIPMLVILGLTDIGALFLLYYVLRHVSANIVAPFQYSGILWGLIFGYIFFGDTIDMWATIGAVVIVISGIKFVRLHVKKESY